MLDLAALAAPTWVETAGLGRRLDFGCIPLSPGDFDNHASTLFGLVPPLGEVALGGLELEHPRHDLAFRLLLGEGHGLLVGLIAAQRGGDHRFHFGRHSV